MAAARRTDPATSHAAAVIDPAARDALQATILRTFNKRPRTGYADHELVEAVTQRISRTPQRIRSARSDLAKLGLVRPNGEYRKTPAGYSATVWVLT